MLYDYAVGTCSLSDVLLYISGKRFDLAESTRTFTTTTLNNVKSIMSNNHLNTTSIKYVRYICLKNTDSAIHESFFIARNYKMKTSDWHGGINLLKVTLWPILNKMLQA